MPWVSWRRGKRVVTDPSFHPPYHQTTQVFVPAKDEAADGLAHMFNGDEEGVES